MPNLYTAARQFQNEAEAGADAALRTLATELGYIVPPLVAQAEDAARRVAEIQAAGGTPSEAQVYAAQRARTIAQQLGAELDRVMRRIAPEVLNGQRTAVDAGLAAAQRLVELSLPEGVTLSDLASVGAAWTTAPISAIHAAIGLTEAQTPVGKLLDALGTEAARTARTTLLSGLSAGKSPRVVGRELAKVAGLSQVRAEVIARTETLRAFRTSSLSAWQANPELVKGYRRLCAKSARSCPACLALDGQESETSELMAVHPSDRCAMLPRTPSWRDLGLDVLEAPEPERETGAQWLARQTPEVQEQVLGKGGVKAYQAGAPLSRWAKVEHSEDWGPTVRVARLSEVSG